MKQHHDAPTPAPNPGLAPEGDPIELEESDPSIGTLDEVVFARADLWPVLLIVPLVGLGFYWAARERRRALAALGNAKLVARLVGSVHLGNRLLAAVFVTVATAAVVLGLMRVQYGGTAQVVPASGLDIVLAVDYSKSMLARDVYPSRSERLEAELTRFLEDAESRGDRVGVVVFAGSARGFPVTRDSRLLKLYLDKADPRFERPGGTNLGRALDLSLDFLIGARTEGLPLEGTSKARDATQPDPAEVPPSDTDQAIVLLTDGEDNSGRPLEIAQQAAQLGVRIYTVGIGSKSGEPVQKFDEDGEPDGFVMQDGEYVMTRLDETTLRELANQTDGAYIPINPDTFSLDEVRGKLESLSRSQRKDEIDITREEGYHFAIIPALVLLTLALGLGERRKLPTDRRGGPGGRS